MPRQSASLSGVNRRLTALVSIVAAGALGTACAGAAAGTAARNAAAEIRPGQLAQMVLPRVLITGARLDALQPSASTGEISPEDAPRFTLDPKDTTGDIVDAGWLAGYDRSWGPGFAPDGSFFGSTTVQLFESASAAALFHARQVESFRRFRGRAIEGGWSLAATEQWRVPALGADTWAIRNTFRSKSSTFYDTEIHLRVGRVVAAVGILSSRGTDLRQAIERDGRTLLNRIKRVAGGAK